MSSPLPLPPALTLLSTLSSPTGRGTRAWESTPHPSPSHPILATASSDKSVHIWSLLDFRLLSSITNGHKRSIRTVDWKGYGSTRTPAAKKRKLMLATGSFDANVGIWEHNPSALNSAPGLSIVDDEDASTHSNIEADPIEKDMNEEDEEWLFSTLLTGPDSEIKSISFSPPHYSVNLLATSSRDKSVWVWEEVEDEEWETIAVLQEHAGDVKSVAWCEGASLPSPTAPGDERDGEERIIGYREILASSSYDDTIRLWRDVESEGDWVCVGVISEHGGTVWSIKWERHINIALYPNLADIEIEWEPRLLSCSDDLSVRIWRRELSESEKEKKRNHIALGNTKPASAAARLPSIIRPTGVFERWLEEAKLPEVHVRSVYAVDWSRQSGLVVSCGGDGTIAVYKETPIVSDSQSDGDVAMNGTSEHATDSSPQFKSTWSVVALIEAAHDEYEINHVCFASRRDKHKRSDNEEVIISTGDDGDVKIWTLPQELVMP